MKERQYKRSMEPVFWGLFGAGGMWGAIFAPAIILVLLLLPAFGVASSVEFYLWLRSTIIGNLFLLAMIVLPLWAGAHRVHHTLHDFKVHSPMIKLLCYGIALGLTLVALVKIF